jgi:hypothetical protein
MLSISAFRAKFGLRVIGYRRKSNHRHRKIVCGREIPHNVNNFHQAAANADRVPCAVPVGATVAAAMPRAALGVATSAFDLHWLYRIRAGGYPLFPNSRNRGGIGISCPNNS